MSVTEKDIGDDTEGFGVPFSMNVLSIPGKMLHLLHLVEENLPELLEEPGWKSLLIDYETPHVERLWKVVDGSRLCLHRIHPCETALYHPHPWPSAVRILSGSYVMGIGFGGPTVTQPIEVAKVVLGVGDTYEMVHPDGWHYVFPIKEVSHSIMLMGSPYPADDRAHPRPSKPLPPLLPEVVNGLLQEFQVLIRGEALLD